MRRRLLYVLMTGSLLAGSLPFSAIGADAAETANVEQAQMSVSYDVSSLVKPDGTYWVWGGEGMPTVPTQVHGLTEAEESLGEHLVRRTDGTLWHWRKKTGGSAEYDVQKIPEILDPVAAISIDSAGASTLVLDRDGRVYRLDRWNSSTQEGTERQLSGIDKVREMTKYEDLQNRKILFVFLKDDGSVWRSDSGLASFVQAKEIQGAAKVLQNGVLLKDGTVREWPNGYLSGGKRAAESWSGVSSAIVRGVANIRWYHSDGLSSVAVDKENRLWYWGAKGYSFEAPSVASPVLLKMALNVKEAYIVNRSIVYLTQEGHFEQAGLGTIWAGMPFKRWASSFDGAVPGAKHLILHRMDGTLWGWGSNVHNELGFGDAYDRLIPLPVQFPVELVLNGESIPLTNGVLTRYGQSYVPMRSIFERLGAAVTWDEQGKIASIERAASGDKPAVRMRFNFKNDSVTLNEEKLAFPRPMLSEGGITYLPLRVVSESLGANVEWVKQEGRIYIEME
ncbi:stalk domain-containing protein [Cohnella sp. AR92]|uniref:stalk domain-containing protein n=1 Tax=Cohnella sp. AR92 TaxID=648716 RepID=UPI0013151258|nr:stalk domain-containing protein [Cohnella sp. AR92]